MQIRTALATLAILCLLAASAHAIEQVSYTVPASTLTINGSDSDWGTNGLYSSDATGDSGTCPVEGADWQYIRLGSDSTYLYGYFQFRDGNNPAGGTYAKDAVMYIDTDNNASTGFSVNGIGADLRLSKIYTSNPNCLISYASYDTATSAWSSTTYFSNIGTIAYTTTPWGGTGSAVGTRMEWQVSLSSLFANCPTGGTNTIPYDFTWTAGSTHASDGTPPGDTYVSTLTGESVFSYKISDAPAPTYHAGDANGDGSVDFTDLTTLLSFYNQTSGMVWANGDFNADGSVDFTDMTTLLSFYNQTFSATAGSHAAVPEPSTLLLTFAGLAGLLAYAWRKRK